MINTDQISQLGMDSFELDHIGVAVSSLEEGQKFYKALGFSEMQIEEVESEKVRVGFLKLNNQCSIELLEPTSEDSPIAKFLSKRGAGVHHYCLRVQGIDALLEKMKSQGIQLINEVAKMGAHNCRVAFVHPKSTGGVLLELSEKVQ